MIHYKGARHGIEVVIREESYTSKASCLDLDSIPDYQAVKGGKVVPLFSGRRVKRGLYKTGSGALLNRDRKSTRLNSSHVAISYAVFCLKKKRKNEDRHITDKLK